MGPPLGLTSLWAQWVDSLVQAHCLLETFEVGVRPWALGALLPATALDPAGTPVSQELPALLDPRGREEDGFPGGPGCGTLKGGPLPSRPCSWVVPAPEGSS